MNKNDLIEHEETLFPAIDGYVLKSNVISTLYRAGFRKAADYCKGLAIVEPMKWKRIKDDYISREDAAKYAESIRQYLNELYNDGRLEISDVDWRVLMEIILSVGDIPAAKVKPVVTEQTSAPTAVQR